MRILKVINNNIVMVSNDQGEEVMVMGSGIGFRRSKGDLVERSRVEKVFRLSNEKISQFEKLVKTIPPDSISLAEKIIAYARETIRTELNDNIYISLTDHLNYALERKRQGIEFQNAILWEIRRYYPDEYAVGRKAVEMIKEELGIELSEDEAGFFALHVVNAELKGETAKGMDMPELIKDIVNLVKFTTGTNISEEGLSYDRFITHIKFFLQRIIAQREYDSDDLVWTKEFTEKYPLAYKCALRIGSYVKAKLKFEVSEEELTYLTVHIQRMISR